MVRIAGNSYEEIVGPHGKERIKSLLSEFKQRHAKVCAIDTPTACCGEISSKGRD